MKTYIGCKRIEAEPLTRGEYNDYRGWKIPENENPNDEGYIVKHPDGYISWSPKNIFEEAYREEETNPLLGTMMLMKSKDYKERFIAEYGQLVIRYEKLKDMLDKWDKNELEFTPTCPRELYDRQIEAMSDYITVLEKRSVIEGIASLEGLYV